MTEKLLKQMMSIVDAKMKAFKTDFYKYDLRTLCQYEEDCQFVWEVAESHTRLDVIDKAVLIKELDESEYMRFHLMSPNGGLGMFFTSTSYLDDTAQSYYYNGEELIPTTYKELAEKWAPIEQELKQYVLEHYPKEASYYGKKVPVHFSSKEEFCRFLNIARENSKLLECVSRFRHYTRNVVDDCVVIGFDWAPKSFSFYRAQNGNPIYNGGILYHDPRNDQSMAVCIDEINEPEWRIHT